MAWEQRDCATDLQVVETKCVRSTAAGTVLLVTDATFASKTKLVAMRSVSVKFHYQFILRCNPVL